MKKEILDKLLKNETYHKCLRENSNWYKKLNRNPNEYDNFVNEMKIKYKLRVIDKIDNIVDGVDLITKIISSTNE